MKCSRIKYLRRFNLGDYQHEEFEVEYVMEENAPEDAAKKAFMVAREDCAKCSTVYLKAMKEKEATKAKQGATQPQQQPIGGVK